LLAGTLVFLFLPLRCCLWAPALAQAKDAEQIYVTTAGALSNAMTPCERVASGQVIAQLTDAETSRKVAEFAGLHKQLLARVKHLDARAAVDADAAAELVIAREMCADAAQRLHQQRRDEQSLTLTAPVAGVIIPPPPNDATSHHETKQLPGWSGTPLDSHNAGCYLERGTLFCMVAEPGRLEAVAFVNESDVQYVHAGQGVRLWFNVGPAVVVHGEVTEIAEGDLQFVPPELAAEKELASRSDSSGNRRALETTYQVRIQFADHPLSIISGARGFAKIEVEPQTLALRAARALRRMLLIKP
jgi:putative peptide zinc metalloprotease protein